MTAPRSPSYQLANHLLDGELAEFLATWRGNGDTLARITRRLESETGVEVTTETVRQWCLQLGIKRTIPTEAAS